MQDRSTIGWPFVHGTLSKLEIGGRCSRRPSEAYVRAVQGEFAREGAVEAEMVSSSGVT